MQLTTQGLVLREVNYKESDKILTVLTQDMGKLTVSARGSRKKGGGISAAAQMLVWSEMTLYEYRQRWSLKEAVTNREFRGVREDLESYALACYFAEIIDQLTPEQLPVPELLALILSAICGNPNPSQPCFHLREGVLHCKTCPVGTGETLPLCPDSLAALRHIVGAPSKRLYAFRLGTDALGRLAQVCEGFLLSQMDRRFHTLEFYKQVRGKTL